MGQIISGIPSYAGSVDGPNAESKSPNILFNGNSASTTSHMITVNQNAIVLRAFNLSGEQAINVIMVTNDGIVEQASGMSINGKLVMLTPANNCLVIDISGNYRFTLSGGGLGSVSCVFHESGMVSNTYGLSDFSAGT